MLIVGIVSGVLVLLTISSVVIFCHRRWRRRRRYAGPYGELRGKGFGKGSSYGSGDMWKGQGNPTEQLGFVEIQAKIERIQADLERTEAENRALYLVASNFCRSTSTTSASPTPGCLSDDASRLQQYHGERVLKAALPIVGKRKAKFWAIVSDLPLGHHDADDGDQTMASNSTDLMLTLIDTRVLERSVLLPLSSSKSMQAWRSWLLSLSHPFVEPMHDVAVTRDGFHLAILRAVSQQGSARDLLYADRQSRPPHPCHSYYSKYLTIDRSNGTLLTREGHGLPPNLVARFAKQVLEALKYLEGQSIPYTNLHTGNMILRESDEHGLHVRLSDVENAFLGVRPRYYRKIRRMQCIDPILASFVLALYEMCTGIEAKSLARDGVKKDGSRRGSTMASTTPGNSSPSPESCVVPIDSPTVSSPSSSSSVGVDLTITDQRYALINDLIQRVIKAEHAITYDELLADPVFRDIPSPSIPYTPPRTLDSCQSKILQPVLSYHSHDLFPNHPNLSSITVPMPVSRSQSRRIRSGRSTPTHMRMDSDGDDSMAGSPSSVRTGTSLPSSLVSTTPPAVTTGSWTEASGRASPLTGSPSGRRDKEKRKKRSSHTQQHGRRDSGMGHDGMG